MHTNETLPYALERLVVIGAPPETVFRYFTDSARWAAWWGAGSAIDARPGGRVLVRHPNGVEAVGEIREIRSPERIVFTFGYPGGKPMPPEGSLVTIGLEPHAQGTLLKLRHEFAEEGPRNDFVQGWRFQLSLFANAVANEVNAGAADAVDMWFALWTIPDEGSRAEAIARIASPEVRFRDRYSLLDGIEELAIHIGAAQRFMPGIRMERQGEIRHCLGTVLADWVVRTSDGSARMKGTNVFQIGPRGKIEAVTGISG